MAKKAEVPRKEEEDKKPLGLLKALLVCLVALLVVFSLFIANLINSSSTNPLILFLIIVFMGVPLIFFIVFLLPVLMRKKIVKKEKA